MHCSPSTLPLVATLFASLTLAGCGAPAEPQDDATLIIRGSVGAPSANGPAHSSQGVSPDALTGDPASLTLNLYQLYIGAQGDCSDLALLDDHGTTPIAFDLAENPVLFSASPADGAYGCVAFVMSDLVRVIPSTSFGGCEAGKEYVADVYRQGQSGLRDISGTYLTGTGTDEAPHNDIITLILTRNPTAAVQQGYSTHQIIPLASPLVVPGTSTFYWNGEGSVVSEQGRCGVYPGQPEFL